MKNALAPCTSSYAEAPLSLIHIYLTPVDWCAAAVLALWATEATALHLMNPCPPSMSQVAQLLVPDLEIVPDEAYGGLLLQRMNDENRDILAPLLDYVNRMKTSGAAVRVE